MTSRTKRRLEGQHRDGTADGTPSTLEQRRQLAVQRYRRPETAPTKTPEDIESAIIQLRQTLAPDGADTVSARVIQRHLSHHSRASLPSLRTIYRILNRQPRKGASQSVPS